MHKRELEFGVWKLEFGILVPHYSIHFHSHCDCDSEITQDWKLFFRMRIRMGMRMNRRGEGRAGNRTP
jgi:hypothetical protein